MGAEGRDSATQAACHSQSRPHEEPIAVVGIGCRAPGGVSGREQFVAALSGGLDAIQEVPEGRWDVERYYSEDGDVPGKCPVKRGGFVRDIDLFDPMKFGISAREAEEMDPQHRLLLEVTWEAMSDAGRSAEFFRGTRTSVFVGVSMDDYSQRGMNSADTTRISAYSSLGTARSIAAGRIPYVFDLRGPAMQLDTTCSSSLLGIHLACHSLRRRESDFAIAGGVNALVAPSVFIGFWNLNALSPNGTCCPFDARANGYVRGEGCSLVLLRRLSDALRDKDRIVAVIRGSGTNHDGRSNGMTAPNGQAQVELIRRVLAESNTPADTIGFVEAHGTGTELGDPIEVDSISRAMGCEKRQAPLYLGSLKANFGHLESAAGATSFIKAALSVQTGSIFPQVNFQTPNPRIRWSELAVRIPTRLTPWPIQGRPRRAGVNAFGMSGTNVHLVLEEHEGSSAPTGERTADSFIVQEKNEDDARRLALDLAKMLESGTLPAELALTLGEAPLRQGVVGTVVARSAEEAARGLRELSRAGKWKTLRPRRRQQLPRVAFVFSGQGSEVPAMGTELLLNCEPFARHVASCDRVLSTAGGHSFRELCEMSQNDEVRTDRVQVYLFVFQYAAARCLMDYGVVPATVMGHSLGEITAAAVAGALTLEDAMRLVMQRGRLMKACRGEGAMLAVMASADQTQALLTRRSVVAGFNGPKQHVVSGPVEEIAAIEDECERLGIRSHRIVVAHAFHSPAMEDASVGLLATCGGIVPRESPLQLISTVSGESVAHQQLTARHWAQQMLQPVRFWQAATALAEQSPDLVIEVTPRPTLSGSLVEAFGGTTEVVSLSGRVGASWEALLRALCASHACGLAVDWGAVHGPFARHRAPRPAPRFQKSRHWIDYSTTATAAPPESVGFPGSKLRLLGSADVAFSLTLDARRFAFVKDHLVHEFNVVPGSTYVSLAAACAAVEGKAGIELEDLVFPNALVLEEGEEHELQTWLRLSDGRVGRFEVHSCPREDQGESATRAQARATFLEPQPRLAEPLGETPRSSSESARAADELFEAQSQRGIELGPEFRWLSHVFAVGGAATALLEAPSSLQVIDGCGWHPGLVDACFQVLGACHEMGREHAYIPFRIERVRILRAQAPSRVWCRASARRAVDLLLGQVDVFDQTGSLILRIEGLEARSVRLEDLRPAQNLRGLTWSRSWFAAPPIPSPVSFKSLSMYGRHEKLVRAIEQTGSNLHQVDFRWPRSDVQESILLDSVDEGQDSPTLVVLPNFERGDVPTKVLDVCMGLLQLVRSARRKQARRPLVLVTQYGSRVAKEAVCPNQSAVVSFWQSLRLEVSELSMEWVDLDEDERSASACVGVLAGSLRNREEQGLCFRAGKCFRPRLSRYQARRQVESARLDPKLVYVVTGGTRGLGKVAAEALIQRGAKRLVLVCRVRPPHELVESLVDQGANEVEIQEFDLAAVLGRTQLIQYLNGRSELGGIVHAAGIASDRLSAELTREDLDACFSVKALSASVLAELCRSRSVPFLLSFSSIASVLGSSGQAAYALANGFLDGLALGSPEGSRIVSLNLGPWDGVGMTRTLSEEQRTRLRSLGLRFLQPDRMGALLDFALTSDVENLIVADLLPRRMGQGAPAPHKCLLGDLIEREDVRDLSEEFTQLQLVERNEALTTYLVNRIAKMFGIPPDRIDPGSSLNSLGLDSLMAVELHDALRRDLGTTLSMTELLAQPQIKSLAKSLALSVGDVRGSTLYDDFLRLREGNSSSQPLYCIHAVDGEIGAYFELATALSERLDVWGIRSPHRHGYNSKLSQVRDIAEHYAHGIQERSPEGKVHLLGWSFGGVLCVETARMLLAAGRDVGGVVLLDSYAPFDFEEHGNVERLESLSKMLAGILQVDFDCPTAELAQIAPGERIDFLLERAEALGRIPRSAGGNASFRSGIKAMISSTVGCYGGRALVVSASREAPHALSNSSSDWKRWLPSANFHSIDSTHHTIHAGDSLAELAPMIDGFALCR